MGLQYYTLSSNIRSKSLACRHIRSRFQRGQTLAEYALIVAFISVVAIGTLMALGNQTSGVFTTVNRQLNASTTGDATTSTAPARGH